MNDPLSIGVRWTPGGFEVLLEDRRHAEGVARYLVAHGLRRPDEVAKVVGELAPLLLPEREEALEVFLEVARRGGPTV